MIKQNNPRRNFIKQSAIASMGAVLATGITGSLIAKPSSQDKSDLSSSSEEPIIDIHQHMFYMGRTDAQLIAHQKTMGVSQTIMLPAGSVQYSMSTHFGFSNGLEAQAGINQACYAFSREHPNIFFFAANEVPDLPTATTEVEKYLKLGGKMIAEVKFGLACDSPGLQKFYQLAADYDVPILMHWQFEVYNFGLPRFYKMLERYPKTKFIGHAQTWWANIDKNQEDHPWELYPKGPVTPVGITDRYLSDYENMYSDLSAGSCLNGITRDEDFTKDFFTRHQDKLMFGSDCSDTEGQGPNCEGAQIIAVVRRLTPSKNIERKLLYENAKKMFNL